MQTNSPWYTPPSSALHNEHRNSNYFYNYNHQWNRPPENYDSRSYQNYQQMHTNGMRSSSDNYPQSSPHPSSYESNTYRSSATGYEAGPPVRSRNRVPTDAHQAHSDKHRHFKMSGKPNDCEGENFSSVFTQSLTSLYSQDADVTFVEEKNFSDNNAITCPKIKTEEPDCPSEYSFNSVYNSETQNRIPPNFDSVKIKQEPFTRENVQQYDGYSLDDMYVRRKRGTLAEAYSRKRKHSVPTSAYQQNSGHASNGDKTPKLFQPECQWIPNSVGACEDSSETYQSHDFSDRYSGYEPTKMHKRHVMKSRITRGKSDTGELKSQNGCKKIPKKVSPLTVYVKVIDDRIIDVTCRRYKKRSKPKNGNESFNEHATETHGNSMNSHNQAMRPNESWNDIFEAVGGILRNLVDEVAKSSERREIRIPDLATLHPMKTKELIYKFCYDYSLDYRDFADIEEIFKTHLTSSKEDPSSRKRKSDRISNADEHQKVRRGRSADKDDGTGRKKEPEKSATPENIPVIIQEIVSEEMPEKLQEKMSDNKQIMQEKMQRITSDKESAELPEIKPEKLEKVIKLEKVAKLEKVIKLEKLIKIEKGIKLEKTEKIKEKIAVTVDIDEEPEPVKSKAPEKIKIKAKPGRNSKQQHQPQEEEQPKRHPDPKSVQPRVLRSLPSRQPRPASKKPRSRRRGIKGRYPKRNLRSRKGIKAGKKLKIVIDLSKESDIAEVLELESDTNSIQSKKLDTKSDVESEVEAVSSNHVHEAKTDEKENEQDAKLNEDCANSVSNDNCSESATFSNDVKTLLSYGEEEDEDIGLRQPPQLVRMTDERNSSPKVAENKELTSNKNQKFDEVSTASSEICGPVITSDNAPPPTLQPNENYLSDEDYTKEKKPNEIATEEKHDLKSETDESLNLPPAREEDLNKQDIVKKENFLSDVKSINEASRSDSNSEDDCIVISAVEPEPSIKKDIELKPSDLSNSTLLRERLLEKPFFERELPLPDVKTVSLSTSLKAIAKDERDESILRTLLLESDAVSNAGIVKELESSGASTPVIASILSSAERDTLASLNLEELQSPDFSGQMGLDASVDLSESLKLSCYNGAYLSSLSPEMYEEAQKHFKHNPSPPLSEIIPKCETKEAVMTDPQELREKIRKLKDEIVYLQVMAEQKEKERIAIICFRKYKEEILRRIYKVYAFSVQDHVRDWIYSKRHGQLEYNFDYNRSRSCTASSSSTNSSTSSITNSNQRAVTEAPKSTASDNYNTSTYSSPSHSHRSVNHKSPSLQSPQKSSTSTSKDSNTSSASPPSNAEKVSTVETMVAKATQNYGLDMTNLRERLKSSPSETSKSSTILQKVLSTHTSSRNPTPDHPYVPRPWTPEKSSKSRNSVSSMKPCSSTIQKPYADHNNNPSNMIMNQTSRVSHNNTDVRSFKNDEYHKNRTHSSRSSHGVAEKSQIQALLAEPVQIKAHRNPYRSWSIQSGGRVSEDRSAYAKHGAPPNIPTATSAQDAESPLQRQLNSTKGLPVPSYGMPSTSLKASYNTSNHQSSMHDRNERPPNNVDSIRSKKMDEDRRQIPYDSGYNGLSSSGAISYGRHSMGNVNSLATSMPQNKVRSSVSRSSPPMCMACGLTTAKFICSGCRKHWYCSSQCQCLIWPEHSRVCEGRQFSDAANTYS